MGKLVIFGASGFIGSRVSHWLRQENGCEVLSYSSGNCNLLDGAAVSRTLGTCDEDTTLVVCSAVTRCVEESWSAMLENITMIQNIVSNAPAGGLRSIIFLSSADVYGMPPETLPVREDTKFNPSGYYGLSKLICEQLLRFHPVCRLGVAILRLPAVYGIGDRSGSIVGNFARKILHGESIELHSGGLTKRDFVEVSDLCRVIAYFVEKPFSGAVNVATGESIAIKDLISIAAQVIGRAPNVRILPGTDRKGDLIFDTGKLKSLYPGVTFVNIKEGIESYMHHLKSDYNRKQ